jgi:membrane-associated protease RseP (regulator of RpoE activity)
MRRVVAFLFVLCAATSTSAELTIAVLGVRASGEADSVVASALTPFLRNEIGDIQEVTTRATYDDLASVLAEQGFALTGAVDPAKAAQVGKVLAVDEVLVGELIRLGDTYTLFLQRVSVETAEVVATGSASLVVDKNDDLPQLVEPAIADLARGRTEATRADTTRRPEGVAFFGMLVAIERPDVMLVRRPALLRIIAVDPNGPAAAAGIKPGMVISAINDRRLPHDATLRGLLHLARNTTDEIRLTVIAHEGARTVVLPTEHRRPLLPDPPHPTPDESR